MNLKDFPSKLLQVINLLLIAVARVAYASFIPYKQLRLSLKQNLCLGPPDVTAAIKRKEAESGETPGAKRKRVSFGPYVSPEYFDKTLPPSTPVRKGAEPPRDAPLAPSTDPRPDRDALLRKTIRKRVSALPSQVSTGWLVIYTPVASQQIHLNPFLPDCKTSFSRIFKIFLFYF